MEATKSNGAVHMGHQVTEHPWNRVEKDGEQIEGGSSHWCAICLPN
jgi:hypothetical protein